MSIISKENIFDFFFYSPRLMTHCISPRHPNFFLQQKCLFTLCDNIDTPYCPVRWILRIFLSVTIATLWSWDLYCRYTLWAGGVKSLLPLRKKWRFLLRISTVNVTKSAHFLRIWWVIVNKSTTHSIPVPHLYTPWKRH